MSITVTRQVELTRKNLCDLFCTAFEGGSNYWCSYVEYIGPKDPEEKGVVWWGSKNLYDETFKIQLIDGEDEKTYTVDWDMVQKGFAKLPYWLMARLLDDYDAGDADVMLQYIVFGEEVYG